MTGHSKTLLALAGAALLTVTASAQQGKPATPATGTDRPRLVPALQGEAEIAMTDPVRKRTAKELVTTFKVKNLSKQPVAGFKVEEYFYDSKGTILGGDTFRSPKPIQPDEVITVTLNTPLTGKEVNSNYKFTHARGTVKAPKKVKTL
jgi:hypothetical protein